jgi:glutamate-1-semialdehyde 2,1-aminomutase
MSASVRESPAPASAELYERALKHLPGGNTRSTVFMSPSPPYARSGKGCRITDVDGHEVIDFLNNYTALIHGHARREIVEAAVDAVASGSCFGMPTEHEIELAERLAARVGSAPKWRFVNSGTEAVMAAVRLARAATGRSGVIRFQDAYHGTYDAAIQPPARGVPASVEAEVTTVPYGDIPALQEVLDGRDSNVACVLFDAIPARAGARFAESEFVHALRSETRKHDVILIHDEVISLRLAYGGVQSLYAYEPDLTTVGKIIGGGFPIGAVGGREDLLDLFDPRRTDSISHAGTFNANPVSMRAGIVSVDLLTEKEIERINALGDQLRGGLEQQGWDVRGLGSLLQVVVDDPATLWWNLYRAGILAGGRGLLCTSTAMDESIIDHALDVFAGLRAS